jgi:hypothetical protein
MPLGVAVGFGIGTWPASFSTPDTGPGPGPDADKAGTPRFTVSRGLRDLNVAEHYEYASGFESMCLGEK